MPRSCLAFFAVTAFAGFAISQVPNVGKVSTKAIERSIDRLVEQVDQVRFDMLEAKKKLVADEEARDAHLQRIKQLSEQLQRVAIEFANATDSLRQQTDPLRTEIREALRLPELTDAEKALKAIEQRELNRTPNSKLIGLVQFSLAGVLRLRAEREIGASTNDQRAVLMLNAALDKYEDVLKANEVSDPEIGSSSHAASMRHIVQINASLFEGYRDLYRRQPNSSNYKKKRDDYLKAGKKAVGDMQRRFADARMADGTRVLDAIADDVKRLVYTPRRR